MASGTIEAGLIVKEVSLGQQTIGSGGWTDIKTYIPSVNNKSLLCVQVSTFGSTSSAVAVTSDGHYLFGTPNTTITYLHLRYIFY